jgi:hypothetical protein
MLTSVKAAMPKTATARFRVNFIQFLSWWVTRRSVATGVYFSTIEAHPRGGLTAVSSKITFASEVGRNYRLRFLLSILAVPSKKSKALGFIECNKLRKVIQSKLRQHRLC